MSSPDLLKGEDLPDAKDFYVYLKEAQATDLTDIERTGCISAGRDLKGNPVIVLIPVLGVTPGDKVEVSYRKMLLLFIRKAHEIVGSNYAVVYAHTNVDIINQYPLIYKFYSVLPREFKKNLTKMYVIHPNVGLKMFFEFARVFLSHKFYSKLVLLDSILEFQRLIPPMQLMLPLRFLRKEDEIRGLKFYDRMASLKLSFDPSIGTTRSMHVCATFLKLNGGLQTKGLFRIAGDAGDINLVKIRLQYAHQNGDYTERIMLSENKDYILVGNMDGLQKTRPLTLDRKPSGDVSTRTKPGSESSKEEEFQVPEELPMSVVVISDIHTVARILSMSISHLPETLVPYELYCKLMESTRKHERSLSHEWEHEVAETLAELPHHHLSTLVYLIQFLREVASFSAVNAMDSTNLAIVFAPTIFESPMIDPVRAAMEIKLSKVVLKELIDRRSILQHAMHVWRDHHRDLGVGEGESDKHGFIFENQVSASVQGLLGAELNGKMNIEEVRSITDNFTDRFASRLNLSPRGGSSMPPTSDVRTAADGSSTAAAGHAGRFRKFSVDSEPVMEKDAEPLCAPITFSKDESIVSPSPSTAAGSTSNSALPTPVRKAVERARHLSTNRPGRPPHIYGSAHGAPGGASAYAAQLALNLSRDEDDDDSFATPPPGSDDSYREGDHPAFTGGSEFFSRAGLPLPALPTDANHGGHKTGGIGGGSASGGRDLK